MRLDAEAQTYVEKTLDLFASWGGGGVVVLTPTQPQVLTAAQEAGWRKRHAEVLRLLERLQQEYDFVVVDMTSVSSFDGDPAGFFDATHMTTENQRRMQSTPCSPGPAAGCASLAGPVAAAALRPGVRGGSSAPISRSSRRRRSCRWWCR